MIDTPICENKLAGMAIIRTASNRKRELRILGHLARSSFDCPVKLYGCGLRGVRALGRIQEFHGCAAQSEQSDSLCSNMSRKETGASPENNPLAPAIAKFAYTSSYSVTLMARLTPG